jgi:hypothetical protein
MLYPEVDKAVGISDKGEVSNVTSNFGLLSYHHYFTPACHWNNAAPFAQQYCVGFGFCAARCDTVIESFDHTTPEWAPLEGSYGTLYSGEVTSSDGTPIVATSDNIETWPWVGGERVWPGPYRRDSLGQEVEGEFTSDQDLFFVFNDQDIFGLQVDQSVYSYGRIYAQDFIFLDFHVYNTRQVLADDIYLGFRCKMRCDYDMQDYIGLYRDSTITFVYYWDADGIAQDPWESVGMIGIGFLNEDITDFHYFRKEDEPDANYDNMYFPIITSDPSDPDIDSALFFHGADIHIDDPSIVQSLPPESTSAYNFIAASGPKTFSLGDTVQLTVVVVCGEDSADLFSNLDMALVMADNYFLGSGPPLSPAVSAVPGDRQVTLYWDAEPSESSTDIITGKSDFEGYKIYRSEDQGLTWGPKITNNKGEVVGYVPIAQFDLKDSIFGIDPAFPYQSLGDETGLRHTYTDSSVYNGIEYWYCVAAYDQGNQAVDSLEPSYENPKGRPQAANIVSVIPAQHVAGYIPVYLQEGDTLESLTSPCEGLAIVSILDPEQTLAHSYEITFNDSLFADTAWVDSVTFNLVDLTSGETLFLYEELSDSSLDNIPVIHGFRLTLFNSGSGVKFLGWTEVGSDTCSFDWWTGYVGSMGPLYTYISGTADFRIKVDHANPATVQIEDGFGGTYPPISIPIRVYDITDSLNPVDVSDSTWLLDFAYAFPGNPLFGPEGWDLIPGGAGYNPSTEGQTYGFVDQIGCWNGAGDGVYIATQNGPDTATAPSEGDEFTILTYKPFSSIVRYEFTVTPYSINTGQIDLSSVRVVPNPYILHSRYESTPYDRRLMFTNLPQECEILIYNIAGEHIKTIAHDSNLSYEYWDLRTKYGLEVAYGLYVFVVKNETGTKAKGRFVIVK